MTVGFNPEPQDRAPVNDPGAVVECGMCEREETMTVEEAVDHEWARTRRYGLCCRDCVDALAAREDEDG